MIIPIPPMPGERVALIAPSGAVPMERIGAAVTAIESFGFIVEAALGGGKGYLAAKDSVRAGVINTMFSRPDIRGIFAARGGYGAGRLMELLDFAAIGSNPKFFAGYSDVTALHTVFNQVCGFATFHTPMAATELYCGADDYTTGMFKSVISGSLRGIVLNPPGREMKSLTPGRCSGILTGGNLTTIASMLGTAYEIDTRGKILLLEDVAEEPYRLDRMLNQLRLSGKLNDAAGIVMGGFTNCGTEDEFLEICQELLPPGKPAIYNVGIGHCMPTMSLPLGVRYSLDAGKAALAVD